MKVMIREFGENGARRRRLDVAYKFTKCNKFRNHALSCKSLTQDPNALKIKRKPKSEQARVEPKQKNVHYNAHVQPNVHVDVQLDVHSDMLPDVHGDVQPDTSQAGNKVDADNKFVVDDNVATSQASSCVVDTR
ncbi:unnamed protein product [Lathyrus oleraceus]